MTLSSSVPQQRQQQRYTSPSSGNNSVTLMTDEGTARSSNNLCSSLPICTEADEPGDFVMDAAVAERGAAAVGFRGGCCDEAAPAGPDLTADWGVATVCWQCSSDSRGERSNEAAAKRRRLAARRTPEPAAAAARCHECKADPPAALALEAAPLAAALGAASAVEGCTPAAVLFRRALPSQHRALIVGWMREVCCALGLHPSTLFSAASLLDRFVAAAEALPSDGLLQLLALSCMSVAAKYNESVHVQPSTWLGLAVDPEDGHNLYQARDLQRCEFSLLQTIQWRLHDPTTHTFLEHFLMRLRRPPGGGHLGQQASSCSATFRRRTEGGAPNASVANSPAASSGGIGHGGCQGGDNSSFDPWDSEVAATALALAELSLLYDNFLLFDYSTIALACVSLAAAQRPTRPTGAAVVVAEVPPPPTPPLAAAYGSLLASTPTTIVDACVAAAGGLPPPLGHLAPADLSSCINALQMYCCWA